MNRDHSRGQCLWMKQAKERRNELLHDAISFLEDDSPCISRTAKSPSAALSDFLSPNIVSICFVAPGRRPGQHKTVKLAESTEISPISKDLGHQAQYAQKKFSRARDKSFLSRQYQLSLEMKSSVPSSTYRRRNRDI